MHDCPYPGCSLDHAWQAYAAWKAEEAIYSHVSEGSDSRKRQRPLDVAGVQILGLIRPSVGPSPGMDVDEVALTHMERRLTPQCADEINYVTFGAAGNGRWSYDEQARANVGKPPPGTPPLTPRTYVEEAAGNGIDIHHDNWSGHWADADPLDPEEGFWQNTPVMTPRPY